MDVMDPVQRFIFDALNKTHVLQWQNVEFEARKGFIVNDVKGFRSQCRFSPGVSKTLFQTVKQTFECEIPNVDECHTKTTYDVFYQGLRTTIDAKTGQIVGCIQKKTFSTHDEPTLRYSAALETPYPPPTHVMQLFECIHPWKSIRQGVPVQVMGEAPLQQGNCGPHDPFINQNAPPDMLWIIDGFPLKQFGEKPTSTITMRNLAYSNGEFFCPAFAYRVTVFPRMTKPISPFNRRAPRDVSLFRKKTRTRFRLGYGVEIHLTETQTHKNSLVGLELQPKNFEIEYEMLPAMAIKHHFFKNEIANIHIIIEKKQPQFLSHTVRNIPHCHIHIVEDTDFALKFIPLLMNKGDRVCVHNPHFLIGNVNAFTDKVNEKKCRTISKTTTLFSREQLVNGGVVRYKETADGAFTDIRTMKRAKINTKKTNRKRKREQHYNIQNIIHHGNQVSEYVISPHYEYVPYFGFQLAEIFERDVKHLLQHTAPFENLVRR